MKNIVKNLFSDTLLKQSGLIFASSVLVNICNLIFRLYTVRSLSPEDFGIFISLVSIMAFFSIPTSTLQTVITRYTSKYSALDKKQEINSLFFNFIKIICFFVVAVFVFFVLFSGSISDFLHIKERGLIFIVVLGVVFSSFSTVTLGVLFGLQKFNTVAFNNTLSGIGKLFMGFFLVMTGFRVAGAILGFVFSCVLALCISIFQLPKWLRKMPRNVETTIFDIKEIHNYCIPVGVGLLCFSALTNMDVILVKHFFSSFEAGYYSAAQTVGMIVLFIPGAVGMVMFPKISAAHAKKENTSLILKKCLIAVAMLCSLAVFFAFAFPVLFLKILIGNAHPITVSLVKFFALSMGFFALVNILMLYNLSLHRLEYIYVLLAAALLQFIGIYFFHSSLQQVLLILSLFSMVLFFLGLKISFRRCHERS